VIACLETLSVPDGLYIDGEFVQVRESAREEIINPANERPIGTVQIAGVREAQEAIRAARAAFDSGPWPHLQTRERISCLERMYQALALRAPAICDLIVAEAGAVKSNARARQFDVPMKHFRHYLDAIRSARSRPR
jgi:aldehyde dehydrogenase (NAD+)